MRVEVDQSGRIEFTGTDTVLAYSNDKQYAILIPSIVKREIVRKYRQQRKVNKMFFLKLFSISIFLLIKDELRKLEEVTIDVEFEGREKDIKRILLNFIRKFHLDFDEHKLLFRRISKKSNAHAVALSVFRNIRKEDRVIKVDEIEKLL